MTSTSLTNAGHPHTPLTKLSLRQRLIATLTLILGTLGAVAISYFGLIHQSLRLDESQTIWQSSHTLGGVLHAVALDVHVPLYHMIVHFWIVFFGNDVVTVRLLSLVFFIATIPVIFAIARRLLTFYWALFATVLFTFSPFMNWYASEARMYTLLVFVASLNQYFFLKVLRTNKGWVGFAVTAVVGAYTHYFFLFTLLAEGVFYLARRRSFAKGSFKRFIAVAVLVVAALMPWLYYFRSLGSASTTRPLLASPSSVDFSNVFSQFIFGFQTDQINTIILSSWPILVLLALIAVRRSRVVDTSLWFVATMAVAPIVIAFAMSLVIRPFFVSRYMVACVGPLLILIVWFMSQHRRAFAGWAAGILVVSTVLGSYQQATSAATPIKEDYRSAVNYLNTQSVPQDLVVLSSPFTIYPVEYYYTGAAQIQTLPIWDRTSSSAIPAFNKATLENDVAKLNKNHRYIYLLLSQDQGYEDTISTYYRTHFKQISKRAFSHDVTLYVYQVGYYTVPPLEAATETVTN